MIIAAKAAAGMLLAEGSLQVPSIDEFLPPEILFQGTPFAINRIILVRIVATVVMLAVLGTTAAKAKLIPGRWQGAVEWLLEFVRDNIVYQVMGEIRGRRYVPMITTMFMTILVFNLCGIIPGLNIAATATIVVPLLFALWTFVQYWGATFRGKGFIPYLREELFPAGVPWPIYIILAPMQLLDIVVIRPFSLTIRLFANMISGHILVALCFAATQYFLIDAESKALIGFGTVTFVGGIVMTLFEAFVAAIQAFIFATLSTVYINLSYPED